MLSSNTDVCVGLDPSDLEDNFDFFVTLSGLT